MIVKIEKILAVSVDINLSKSFGLKPDLINNKLFIDLVVSTINVMWHSLAANFSKVLSVRSKKSVDCFF